MVDDGVDIGHPDGASLLAAGPFLFVRVGHDSENRRGLLDTGASLSCIDVEMADALGLPVVDRRLLTSVTGVTEGNPVYLARMHIPTLDRVVHGTFAGVSLGSLNLAVLLGRDFLARYRMVYDGPSGSVTLAG